MRQHVPGFEHCYIVDTASQLGVRDSRRIVGDYVLTEEDILLIVAFERALP
ncbi:MAG: FAD-dependent oxidoreductase [Actinomycetota bacterium]|nr:FAD-dependent oxidoreductase [Actinomycetota bacterium]